MMHTKNNDFHVGQWVRVNNTYSGPADNVKGVTSKIKGISDTFLILEHRVQNVYSTANLVVGYKEVDKATPDLRVSDKNGRQINVGDNIAYAVYGGELRLGRVLDIVPIFSTRYNYTTKESVRTQTVYLSVQVGYKAVSFNSAYATRDSRFSGEYEATTLRRVTNMNRVVVLNQKSTFTGGISIAASDGAFITNINAGKIL